MSDSIRTKIERLLNLPVGGTARVESPVPTTGLSFRAFAAVYLALLFIALIPLGLVSIPPLYDYPNHLARMYILLHGAESEVLQRFYRVNWTPIPNLAMDLLVPSFAAVMPLELAGRVFVGLTYVLITSGTVALHYALHRRVSLWPLLAFLFLYNRMFISGMMNYLFGVGLFLWAFAAWVYMRERSFRVRLSVSSFLALSLYFSHLSALGLYALAVVGYEIWRWRDNTTAYRRVDGLAIAVPFVLPAFVFAVLSPTVRVVSFMGYERILDVVKQKIGTLFLVASNYNLVLDGVTLWILLCLFIFGLIARTLKVTPPARWPLVFCALAYAVMPSWLFGTTQADTRLAVALVLLWIAATSLSWKNDVWTHRLAIGLAAILVVRIAVVAAHWHSADRVYAEFLAAFEEMPAGSRLLPVKANHLRGMSSYSAPPIDQIASLAVITRSAYVPTIYWSAGAFTITVVAENRPPYRLGSLLFEGIVGERPSRVSYPARNEELANIDYLRSNWLTYDYLLLLNAKNSDNPMPSFLTRVYDGTVFHLYRIRPIS